MWFKFTNEQVDLLESALEKEIRNIGKAIEILEANEMKDSVAPVAARRADMTALLTSIKSDRVIDDSDPYREAARGRANDDLEVDQDAVVSPGGDPGAWVQAWIWISDEEAGIEETAECNRCGETHPVGVMEDDMCPACVDAEDGEDGCSECGRQLDEAGDGYDGMCPTCADQAAATDNYPENWTKDDG